MIDLYTFTTPNGRKVSIMLEELGLPYTVHKVDISKGEQFQPDFLAKNPNGKIPAIVDRETGISVFESGAILLYLAEKSGKLLPTESRGRYEAIAWLMFQMSAVGPMFGQLGFFRRAKEPVPAAIDRFQKEVQRILGVLEHRLAEAEYLAGEYSVADIATYPWVSALSFLGFPTTDYPNVNRWLELLKSRPAVARGMLIPS